MQHVSSYQNNCVIFLCGKGGGLQGKAKRQQVHEETDINKEKEVGGRKEGHEMKLRQKKGVEREREKE